MAGAAYILFADETRWRVGVASAEGVSVVDVPGELTAIAALLREKGYTGQGVVLAMPSQWCLAADVSTAGLPRKSRRQAMVFRLEEKLPLAAEEIVADFIESIEEYSFTQNAEALGICAPLVRLRPMVDTLEAAGVVVQVICPTVLLAAQDRLMIPTDADVFIWADGDYASLLSIVRQTPRAWHLAPNSPRDVLLRLGVMAIEANRKLRVHAFGLEDISVAKAVRSCKNVESFSSDQEDLFKCAAESAREILAGRRQSSINLRRDALAIDDRYRQIARPLNFLAAVTIVALLCVCVSMLCRAHRYDATVAAAEEQAVAVFQQALPHQTPPIASNVWRRLRSEERAMRGIRGESSMVTSGESALVLLRDALISLPPDVPLRLSEIRTGDGTVYLEGQTRTHPDAQAIARGLRDGGKLIVPDPKSEQLADQSVSFIISATSKSTPPAGEVSR